MYMVHVCVLISSSIENGLYLEGPELSGEGGGKDRAPDPDEDVEQRQGLIRDGLLGSYSVAASP